ncbi:MAG: NAD-dependent epimerase/dehydratase family protein [bacterium]
MRILLTGCAGFIGWKVCEQLLDAGHKVTGVDNLHAAYDLRLKTWRLRQLQRRELDFRTLDICDRTGVQTLFAGQRVPYDAVINLAARAGVRQSLQDPWGYFATNVIGTLNLLDACRISGVPKFVLSSTSSVYGDGHRPFREDQPTDRPRSPYAASKKSAETLCATYHTLYGIDVTVLRYFTVYGPAGRPDMSTFRFIRWIAEGEPVVLYGDGTQERDFTFVDDAARGTVAALRPSGLATINLGSDRPVAIVTILSMLERLLQRRAEIERRPLHPADVPATWADISQARRILGWEPRTTLEEGLALAVRWYMEQRTWAASIDLGD